MQDFIWFLKDLIKNRYLLLNLIKNDFTKEYLGSYLGICWAFIQPLVFMVTIWFIFEIGFRSGDLQDGTPFFLYLACGMIPWFFFANTVSSGTNSIIGNAFLVKKVAFRVSILPLVKIGSALIIYVFLLGFIFIILLFYDYYPTWQWLQIGYYLAGLIFLMMGIAWLTASIRVFVKDINNLIAILLQLGFWCTPIFWNIQSLPQNLHYIFNFNPMFYIINGIRDSLIHSLWFWSKPTEMLIFWGYSLIIFIIGGIVFKKLKPHFGDVL